MTSLSIINVLYEWSPTLKLIFFLLNLSFKIMNVLIQSDIDSVYIFSYSVLPEDWVLTESRIPLKPVLGGMRVKIQIHSIQKAILLHYSVFQYNNIQPFRRLLTK